METKETLYKSTLSNTLIKDDEYFKYIFKKTEKIACAVFYITRSERDIRVGDKLVDRVEDTSERLMDISIRALRSTPGARPIRIRCKTERDHLR